VSDRDEEVTTEIEGTPWEGEGLAEDNAGATTGYVTPGSGEEPQSLEELKSELVEGEVAEASSEEEPEEPQEFEEPVGVPDPRETDNVSAKELWDSLRRDPVNTIQSLARYYKVPSEVGAQPQTEIPVEVPAEGPKIREGEEFYDYIGRLQKGQLDEVAKTLRGIVQEEIGAARGQAAGARQAQVQGQEMVKQILGYLTQNHPDWAQYEPEMQELIQRDRGLAQYPTELYRQAKSVANQRGKIKAQRDAKGKVQTGERSTKPSKTAPREARNVREAFEQIKREQGIR